MQKMMCSVKTFIFVALSIISVGFCYPVDDFGDDFLPNIRNPRSPTPQCPACDNASAPPTPNNPPPPPPNNPSPLPNSPPPTSNNPLPCSSAPAPSLPSNRDSTSPCATGATAHALGSSSSGGGVNGDDHRGAGQSQHQPTEDADLTLSAKLEANIDSGLRQAGLHPSSNNNGVSRKVCLFCKIYDSA